MVCRGIKKIDTEYRLVSVGIGWGICGSCLDTFKNMQTQGSIMQERCERHPERYTKEKESEAYLKLMAPVHLNVDYGVSVLRGPLSVMQFREPLQLRRLLDMLWDKQTLESGL